MKFKKYIKELKKNIEERENNRIQSLIKKEEEKIVDTDIERKLVTRSIFKSIRYTPIKKEGDYLQDIIGIRKELVEQALNDLKTENQEELTVLEKNHYISNEDEANIEFSFELKYEKRETLEEAKREIVSKIKRDIKEKERKSINSLIKIEVEETGKEITQIKEKNNAVVEITFKQRILKVIFNDTFAKKFELNFPPLENETDLEKLMEKQAEIIEI